MACYQVRTDLALEAQESIDREETDVHGVTVEEEYREESEVRVTKVVVETKNGARAIGKPMGTYITLEAPGMQEPDEDFHREIAGEIRNVLQELIPNVEQEQSILVVGLGNREVTADALGPEVVDNLFITRHVVREYGKAAYRCKKVNRISGLVPGTMAQTGMETAEILRGVVAETKPDVVVVVDALAARSVKRLNRTIQLTDTGIQPGSGVGNHRNALTKESLGVPVIAIGIPTVVDAATIVNDALEKLRREQEAGESYPQLSGGVFHELNNMYVTNKDIDEMVKRLSFTVSEALNMTFQIMSKE